MISFSARARIMTNDAKASGTAGTGRGQVGLDDWTIGPFEARAALQLSIGPRSSLLNWIEFSSIQFNCSLFLLSNHNANLSNPRSKHCFCMTISNAVIRHQHSKTLATHTWSAHQDSPVTPGRWALRRMISLIPPRDLSYKMQLPLNQAQRLAYSIHSSFPSYNTNP